MHPKGKYHGSDEGPESEQWIRWLRSGRGLFPRERKTLS